MIVNSCLLSERIFLLQKAEFCGCVKFLWHFLVMPILFWQSYTGSDFPMIWFFKVKVN